MKRASYIIVFCVFPLLSCEGTKNEKLSKSKTDDSKIEIHETNPELTQEENFLQALQKQPIQSLPFSFASFLLDSLYNELVYEKSVSSLELREIDTTLVLNNLNRRLNYDLTVEDIHEDTKSFFPSYYSMLIDDCIISTSYFYKRLPMLNNSKEVILTYSKLIQKNDRYIRGLVFEIIVYDTTTETISNRKRIFTGGIAKYDNGYYEGFNIDDDYTIQIKSYTGYEIESNFIERELKVLSDGNIIEVKEPIVQIEYNEQNYD